MNGVSFICRVRDEEVTLARSLHALERLIIPYEIVIILDRCTDRSEEIAKRSQHRHDVQLVSSNVPLSRAGIETLITPAASAHSLATYNSWCFQQARYPWKFKYDADFIASPELIAYLNSGALFSNPLPRRMRLPCRWDGVSNNEEYLSNCLERYAKHVFWEVPIFFGDAMIETRLDLPIEHASTLRTVKAYWKSDPWFSNVDSEEANELRRQYAYVVGALGPEPIGMARAQNPACDDYFRKVCAMESELQAQGIFFH